MINEGLFIGAAGLLGLGGGSLSSLLRSLRRHFLIASWILDRGSESASTLEFNSTLPPNTVTAPFIRNHQLDTFYYVGLTGLSELVSIPESEFQIDESGNGGVIVDSRTAITQLQTDVYSSLSDRRTCHQLTGYRCLTRVIICLLEGMWRCQRCRFTFLMGSCYRYRRKITWFRSTRKERFVSLLQQRR